VDDGAWQKTAKLNASVTNIARTSLFIIDSPIVFFFICEPKTFRPV
jgi:hypothetical protein